MNIVYSTSNLYSSLAGISLTSLLINNTDVETINIIIMDNNISAENKEKLTAMCHYRRYFTTHALSVNPKYFLKEKDAEYFLKTYDAIVPYDTRMA